MRLDEVTGVSVNEVSSELLGRHRTTEGRSAFLKENEASEFYDEIYDTLVAQYPNTVRRSGSQSVDDAISAVLHLEGRVSATALAKLIAGDLKQSLASA